MAAVAGHIAGQPSPPGRWDRDSSDPLKAALGSLWQDCYDRYLSDYRNDTPFGG